MIVHKKQNGTWHAPAYGKSGIKNAITTAKILGQHHNLHSGSDAMPWVNGRFHSQTIRIESFKKEVSMRTLKKYYKQMFIALFLAAFMLGCSDDDHNPPVANDITPPSVNLSVPAPDTTDVPINRTITVTFSEAMKASTINGTSFTVTGPGGSNVIGLVTYTTVGRSASFVPTSDLSPETNYTATITTGVKDLSGNALASNYTWDFTTGSGADDTAPTVSSTDPGPDAMDVFLSKRISITFSEPMDPLTITSANITLADGVTPVSGTLTYFGLTATFTPSGGQLETDTTYTATITTGVRDLAGNAMANNVAWDFTTIEAVAAGPQPVDLGTAGNFVILAKTAVSATGATSVVGHIGVSPAAASFITGFSLIADPTNVFSLSNLVSGNVYAANYAAPTPANMTAAISDMETAYTDASGRTSPDHTELYAGDISGRTLMPGLYKWGTGVLITSAGVTLEGGAEDVWIFQIAKNLTVNNSAIVTLSGGAQAKNVFWQVAGQATIGTSADFKGIILAKTLISLNTGAVMNGRALAQTAVTLNATEITAP